MPLQLGCVPVRMGQPRTGGDEVHGPVGSLVRGGPKCGGRVGEELEVEIVRAAGVGDNRRQRRSDDKAMTEVSVEEWPGAREVARAEHSALSVIPQDEGVVAFEVLKALLAPCPVGGQDQMAWRRASETFILGRE